MKYSSYLAGAGAILCWASLAAAIGESLRAVPPETVLFWGLLAAGTALGLRELARKGRRALSWPGWRVALYGVAGIWGYHTLLVLALANAPLVEANILNYTWTLWIVVLGSLLPGHRFTGRIVLAGLLGFAGVVLTIAGESLLGGERPLSFGGHAGGFALALAASLTWSTFTVFMRRVVPAGQENMALYCLLSAGMAGVFLLARGAPLAVAWEHAGVLAYLGLVPMGLSFVLWERAARDCNMQVLGLMSFFTPVLSTFILSAISGAPVGPDGQTLEPGNAHLQARWCLAIIAQSLEGVGATMAHVVRTRMFVTDISQWSAFAQAHHEAFRDHPPATSMVEVQRLIVPDMLIEIEADAIWRPLE